MLQHCRPYSNPVSSNTRFPRIPSNTEFALPCRTTSRCDSRLSKQSNIRRIRHVLRDTVFFPSPDSTPSAPTDGNAQAEVPSSTPWNAVRPGFGLLRPESKNRTKSIIGDGEEAGQRLFSVNSTLALWMKTEGRVTRMGSPGMIREMKKKRTKWKRGQVMRDTRIIGSFESMMSGSANELNEAHARKSPSDRLAHMPGLS
jgi:hypothetical protein